VCQVSAFKALSFDLLCGFTCPLLFLHSFVFFPFIFLVRLEVLCRPFVILPNTHTSLAVHASAPSFKHTLYCLPCFFAFPRGRAVAGWYRTFQARIGRLTICHNKSDRPAARFLTAQLFVCWILHDLLLLFILSRSLGYIAI
jgi:hypothetical protein